MSPGLDGLRQRIEELTAAGPDADATAAREAFAGLRAALSRGEARAAEPDPDSPTTPRRSPAATLNVTPSTARTIPSSVWK